MDLGYEEVFRLEEEEGNCGVSSTMCLVGMVLTNKSFNAFGMLETMRKAMNPPGGFTAKEIGKNLFSFQFRSVADMQGILSHEPWHFDKNIILLKELGGGEQPSTIKFTTATFWIRIYDLPLLARWMKSVTQLGKFLGEMVEVDLASLEGVSHSIRIKVRVDFRKPLRKGILLEMREAKQAWVEFKYERLPSFFYLCGLLGHMRWECDFINGDEELEGIPEEKLLFGEWMCASPMQKATVSTEDGKKPVENSLRRHLLDDFKQRMNLEMEMEGNGKPEKGGRELEETHELQWVRANLEKMTVKRKDPGEGEMSEDCRMEDKKLSSPTKHQIEPQAPTNTFLNTHTPLPPFINLPQPPTTSINTPYSRTNFNPQPS
ncbi:hypothetical protein ACS0TY_033667 [Phlomoides rotata]